MVLSDNEDSSENATASTIFTYFLTHIFYNLAISDFWFTLHIGHLCLSKAIQERSCVSKIVNISAIFIFKSFFCYQNDDTGPFYSTEIIRSSLYTPQYRSVSSQNAWVFIWVNQCKLFSLFSVRILIVFEDFRKHFWKNRHWMLGPVPSSISRHIGFFFVWLSPQSSQ